MRNGYNRQEIEDKLTIEIKCANDCMKSLELLIPVIEDFDGKMLGSRFEDSLGRIEGVKGHFSIRDYHGTKMIDYRCWTSTFSTDKKGYYIEAEDCSRVTVNHLKTYGNKRIDGKKWIEEVNKEIGILKSIIESMQNDKDRLDEIEEQFKEIKDSIDKFHNSINFVTQHRYYCDFGKGF